MSFGTHFLLFSCLFCFSWPAGWSAFTCGAAACFSCCEWETETRDSVCLFTATAAWCF
ncbi:hypothetical protein GK0921 [Geobacillus kaustophilus HTA426]|uniref:Secreted protein n=1 Tax=Geobacillus kaustophilus (strain HTA426) TaxID=235909 RepID=Q5L1H4_GEOKA|nr:hypothetical protein GK0921 [Geobacillus kaustophilus HTA426]